VSPGKATTLEEGASETQVDMNQKNKAIGRLEMKSRKLLRK
jgi:hypothetical protein